MYVELLLLFLLQFLVVEYFCFVVVFDVLVRVVFVLWSCRVVFVLSLPVSVIQRWLQNATLMFAEEFHRPCLSKTASTTQSSEKNLDPKSKYSSRKRPISCWESSLGMSR